MSDKGIKRKNDDEEANKNDNFKKTNGQDIESVDDFDSDENENLNDLGDEEDSDNEDSDDLEDEDDSGDDDDDESDDSDIDFLNKEIQVEFAAFNTEPDDFHGIKSLLQRLWLKENIDLSELAEILIDENTIASVLKQENEDEVEEKEENKTEGDDLEGDDDDKDNVYGIISLIPFNSYFGTKNCIKQIKDLLLSYIPADNQIHQKLTDPKITCAMVINERFLNLPPKISLPCYEGLVSEVTQYSQSKPEEKAAMSYDFDYIIMLCKILKQKNNKTSDQFIFVNAEDEIFSQATSVSFEYSVANQCDSDVFDWDDDENLFEPYRKVLLLTKQKWLTTVDSLKDCL